MKKVIPTGKFESYAALVDAVINSMKTHKQMAAEFKVGQHVVAKIRLEEELRSKVWNRRRK
jgi:hypothetical protein